MSKVTFEDFLMEKHSEDCKGIKWALIDVFSDWFANLSEEKLIAYGDMFAKEQSKELLEACKYLMGWLHASAALIKNIPEHLQPYLLIEKAEQAIAKAEGK